MSRLLDIPIRGKLILISVLASGIALLLAGSIIVAYESRIYREQKAREISVQAEIVAASVTASLVFNDSKATQQYLGALNANPEITAAGVYAVDGTLFASYSRPGAPSQPLPAKRDVTPSQKFKHDELTISWPVKEGQNEVGSVLLRASVEPLASRLTRYGEIILLVMLGSLLFTIPISMRLHATISNPIREIVNAAREVAAGKLSVKLTMQRRTDEIGVLVETFGRMLENLRRITRQIGDGAQLLALSAGEILSSATQIAASSAQTATAVTETTTTVEEVKHTAQFSSQKAQYVSETAQKTAQISLAGKKSTEKSIEAMHKIQKQVESIADSLIRLSEQSQTIGEIIATVNDLAEQSNLLAVNAAIEASKAGEHGKGFTVVAQEIKSLAEQSKQATTQVRAILADIQKATAAAVLAAEQGSKAVETGVRQSAEAGEAIRLLADSTVEAAQAASQIAASAQQQLTGMDQVALAMGNIHQASEQNAIGTKQVESSAHNLNDLGQKLKSVVEQYR
ncbi:MAG TPA: methyl-accepting chemotaxis protein, partial [Gammaproteobacteria bacterium]|nr:methyl-accepting chemotaxis protein [Gammaproteobacteria bacterium]